MGVTRRICECCHGTRRINGEACWYCDAKGWLPQLTPYPDEEHDDEDVRAGQ